MSKKSKKKAKKINAKKERYAKFRKDKPGTMMFSTPDLPDDAVQQRRLDEQKVESFWRSYRRPPERYVRERDAKSKR